MSVGPSTGEVIAVGTGLLIVALLFAAAATGLVVFCAVREAAEAWQITHRGWVAGHLVRRPHHG
jgi:hypothetical protein